MRVSSVLLVLSLMLGLGILLSQRLGPSTTSTSTNSKGFRLTAYQPAKDRSNEWVLESLCGISCWRNIIPGQTEAHDLIQQLQLDSGARSIMYDLDLGIIEWDYGYEIPVRVNLYRNRANLIVSDLTIGLPDYLTLQEAVNFLGEPSHLAIVAEITPDMTSIQPNVLHRVYIVYLNSGVALRYVRTRAPIESEIEDTSLIDGVVIVEPNIDALTQQLVIPNSSSVLEWQGFNTLMHYCNLAYSDGISCR